MHPLFPAVLLGILLAPPWALTQQQQNISLPNKGEKWLRIETANFTIYGNAEEKIAKLTGANLERLRKTLALLVNVTAVHAPVPTEIFLFKSNKSFAPYLFRVEGKIPSLAGYFIARPDGNYIAISAENGATQTIYHEYLHFFINNTLPGLPLWLNEGLAEYYSSFSSDDKQAKIGFPIKHHLAYLQAQAMMPLPQLFAFKEGAIFYDEESRQGLFYAQSWLLVHYLAQGQKDKSQPRFSQLLARLAQGRPQDQALAETFAMNTSQLQEELKSYLRRILFTYTQISSQELAVATAALVTAMPYEETLVHLGDLLAHLGNDRLQEAEAYFTAALSVKPDCAPAYAGLGYIEGERGKLSEARRHFEKAIQVGPPQAMTYYRYGRNQMASVKSRAEWRIKDQALAHTSRTARTAFQTAVELDKNFIEAYAAFGETFLFDLSSPPDEGISALEIALARLPSRIDIALNLLTLSAKEGDSTKALALLEKVIKPRGKPGDIAEAWQRLVFIEVTKAQQLLEQGKIEEAIRILDRAAARDPVPYMKKQMDEMRQAAEHQRHIDIYNSALIRAANNKFDEALDRLRQVVAACEDAKLLQSVQQALQQVQREQQVAWYNQAIDLLNKNQLRQATALLERIVAAAPLDPKLNQAAKEALMHIKRMPK